MLVTSIFFIFYNAFYLLTLYQMTIFWTGPKSNFADYKFIVAKFIISVFDRVENIVVKEKMLVTSIFLFSHNIFKRLLIQGP